MHSAAAGTNLLTKLIHYRKYLSNLIAGIILIYRNNRLPIAFIPEKYSHANTQPLLPGSQNGLLIQCANHRVGKELRLARQP